jgi:hypothetical protein
MKNPFLGALLALACCPIAGFAATFTVTNNFDSAAGSLRQAILDANAASGSNYISFNIPGDGAQVIDVFSALPAVTDQVTIDGTTQPGYAGAPLIVLNGGGVGFGGLTIAAPNCAIIGLVVGGFGQSANIPRSGIALLSDSNTVTACYIGVSETGAAIRYNFNAGILISNASGNVIGGVTVADRNLIGGNTTGVFITGASASNNAVLGNWFSLGQAGTNTLVNGTDVIISNAPNNTVGGAAPGSRNVMDGFSQDIIVTGGAIGNTIAGNFLNLHPDGSPNTTAEFVLGLVVQNAIGTVIGGTTPGAGNVISGCDTAIQIPNAATSGTVIQGNYLGTDPTGMSGNFNGTSISITGSSGNIIGGSTAGAGNVIVGKGIDVVSISSASNNVVQGNFIGTDATGMRALGMANGSQTEGVIISSFSAAANGNLIGGSAPGARNVISGMTSDGVLISGSQTSNNVVQGNYIGVGADGITPLGNAFNGVNVYGANSNLIVANIIGNNGHTGGASGVYLYYSTNNLVLANTIYSNQISGVAMFGPNVVSQNSIYGNGGLAISAGGYTATPNTPHGRNNYPVLTSVRHGCTDIDGCLDGTPGCLYIIEFFYNNSLAAQLQKYIGCIEVPSGPFQAHFAPPAIDGEYVTATATVLSFPRETSIGSPGILTTPASTPVILPLFGITFSNAIQEELDANFFDPNGVNLLVKWSQALQEASPFWETVKVVPATGMRTKLDPIFAYTQGFYVAQEITAVGNFIATLYNADGSLLTGMRTRLGRLGMRESTDRNGQLRHDGFPAGPVSVVAEKETTTSRGGSPVIDTNRLAHLIDIISDSTNVFSIKVDFEIDTNTPPTACGCNPWCAVMAGLVDGVEQLEISGGANGSCAPPEEAVVEVTPPTGAPFTIPAGQTVVKKPASDGTWIVTSTVCGVTKTSQITIP